MNKILVPIDFSKCSLEALKCAEHTAYRTNSELVLYHFYETFVPVLPDYTSAYSTGVYSIFRDEKEEKKMINKLHDRLKKLVEELTANAVKATYKLVEKSPYDKISSSIVNESKNKYTMIVMGTHGAKGLDETFFGSNTQKVVREAKIPVFIVKKHVEKIDYTKIAFVSDFREETSVKHLEKVIAQFKDYAQTFHLLYINTPSYFEETQVTLGRMEKIAKKITHNDIHLHIFNEFSPEKGVIEFSKRQDIDLFILGTHGYTGIKHLFNHNVVEYLVNHLNKPLLSFNIH